ncbi:MAG: hypothetical protein AAGK78_13305, partial [Planctomycetota bacterium]
DHAIAEVGHRPRQYQPPVDERVVSLHLLPEISDEQGTTLMLDGVYAGNLPLPKAALRGFQARTVDALEERLPSWQSEADIDDMGAANDAAKQLATNRQLVRLLERQPVDPLILFPPMPTGEAVPARIAGLEIEGDDLRLSVVPLTPAERTALLEALRRPLEDAEDGTQAELAEGR